MILTKPIRAKLLKNAAESAASPDGSTDHYPVVKFFGGSCTWLISEMDADGIMFGLCDLGMGCPELGSVSFAELQEIRFPPFRLPVERDRHWSATAPLSAYAEASSRAGRIVDYL